MSDDFAYDAFDLRPQNKIHVRSECRSLLGFTWWRSHVESHRGMDVARRYFRSRDVERAEERAIAWVKRRYERGDSAVRCTEYTLD